MSTGDTRILLRRPGGQWRQPHVQAYTNEDGLQKLLHETPTLIPGVGPAAAVRELVFPDSGTIDLVIVEPSGSIILVECKLARNPEIKRSVIGQIMSYAAAAWRATYEEFDRWFAAKAGDSLAASVEKAAESGSLAWDAEEFRASVIDNLLAGRFRLFIVVDRITDELRGIVEYVNTHTTSELELLALELAYVADGDVEILLPQAHGQESARLKGSQEARPKWTVDDVLSAFAQLSGPAGVQVIHRLRDDILARGGKVYAGQGRYPTMSAYIRVGKDDRAPWAAYADPSGPNAPRVSLNFGSLKKSLTLESVEGLLLELQAEPALADLLKDVSTKEYDAYPSIPITTLSRPGVVDGLIAALGKHLPQRVQGEPLNDETSKPRRG